MTIKIWKRALSLSRTRAVGHKKSIVGGELELHDPRVDHVVSVNLIRGRES
jgi:hypothetical protein